MELVKIPQKKMSYYYILYSSPCYLLTIFDIKVKLYIGKYPITEATSLLHLTV